MKTVKANSGVTYLGTPIYIVNLDYTTQQDENLTALISCNTSAVMVIKRINLLKYVKTIDSRSYVLSEDLQDKIKEKVTQQFVMVEGGMTKIIPKEKEELSNDEIIARTTQFMNAFKPATLPLKAMGQAIRFPHPSMLLPKIRMDYNNVQKHATPDDKGSTRSFLEEFQREIGKANTSGAKSVLDDTNN